MIDGRNIVLVGFAGVGKSTVGRKLAEMLGRKFADTDEMISSKLGLPVNEAYKANGEEKFRRMELDAVLELLDSSDQVIALGGGAFESPTIRKICRLSCTTAHLSTSFENALSRVKEKNESFLSGKSDEEIRQLYEKRYPYYHQCEHEVDVEGLTPEEIAQKIIDQLTAEPPMEVEAEIAY